MELAVTKTYPAEPKSGDGVLGSVIFERINEGDSGIRIASQQLLDSTTPNPQEILVSTPCQQFQFYLIIVILCT